MKSINQERRKNKRYHFKKSPVVFSSTIIGKVADISMGGIQMVHTGNPKSFLGGLCKLSIMSKDYALELQARLVCSSPINHLSNLCRFKFDQLSAEKRAELNRFIKGNMLNLSLLG